MIDTPAISAPTIIDTAVARLDAWLDTMRGPGGYGGPVAHWWQQSLIYTGPGLDWRYEGIIAGYLELWQRSGDARWLAKARLAGDDLILGQLGDGHFAASAFEINPAAAGTPHEAACDVGLLLLARALGGPHPPAPSPMPGRGGEDARRYAAHMPGRAAENARRYAAPMPGRGGEDARRYAAPMPGRGGESSLAHSHDHKSVVSAPLPHSWGKGLGDGGLRYTACAERNLRAFYIGQLWDAEARSFRDSPAVPSFVPNKAATACEALFLMAELTGDAEWVERYALPNLDRIVQHQVRGGKLDGAIAQNSFGARVVEKYFPIYIARCVPALLRGLRWNGDGRYAESALRAMRFIARWASPAGELPTVVYPNCRTNRYPSWVAPLGDVLRAAMELRPYGFHDDLQAIERRLLAGQDASGGIQTATGFAAQAGGRPPKLPDVRDVLHVAGWCDKAFRALAAYAGPALPDAANAPFEAECTFQKQTFVLQETPAMLTVSQRGDVVYRWRKGEPWAQAPHPAFWLR